ncbi:MAG TPA: hypothetical protein VG603_09435, partial [Chitinophagales bacterium]|nr:hypothetical protein [Chitinophagales bacterium]
PLALSKITGEHNLFFNMLVTVGLFGLIASFHGLLLAAGRSTFEFGRMKLAPAFLGRVSPKFQTPANALLLNMFIGIGALLVGQTDQIITISVFGAITLYIIAMASLFALRKNEPTLQRPFKVPFYPVTPLLAFVIAVISIIAMTYYNWMLALIYFGLLIAAYVIFKLLKQKTHF